MSWGQGDIRRNYFVTGTKTAGYVAAVYESVQYDASGGAFEIDLPAEPLLGDVIRFKNVGTSTNVLTVDGNGNNVEDPSSLSSYSAKIPISVAGASVTFEFTGSVWTVVSLVGI